MILEAGDVVTVDFPGVRELKRRPAVIVSTTTYHRFRPDIIVGILTSQIQQATAPTDFVLRDWVQAGLRSPTAFRSFLATLPMASAHRIGRCSDADWRQIVVCLNTAIATGNG